MSLESHPLLVVGAGIGGLSAAIALRRAGFDAAVFERAPELREVGAAISLWPNATRMLGKWGILDEVARRAQPVREAVARAADGRLLHRMALPETDAPSLLVHRADLHAALAAALPPGTVRLGATFTRYADAGGEVVAHFDGPGAVAGRALVGADGLWSAVRAQLLGDGRPIYRGYPVWRGVARLEAGDAVPELCETLGAGRRFGIAPIGGGRVCWWATANEPEGTDDAPEGRKAKLLRLFGRFHAPIPMLLDRTPEEEMLKNGTYDRPPVRGWGRGLVTLLGDAAHPTTPNFGQGGCLAVEDAAVLAAALGDVPE
ncbi:MAG TPA: FAD-dependent monooxygenase, partial [Longimicrobium sp.]|nr:FAD-dependent monooxygenase [Longimicrobium sp.]